MNDGKKTFRGLDGKPFTIKVHILDDSLVEGVDEKGKPNFYRRLKMNDSFCPNCAGAGVYRNSKNRLVACSVCRATGIKDISTDPAAKPCLSCSGSGKVAGVSTLFPEKEIRCPSCGGSGTNNSPAAKIPPEGLSCCFNPKCQYYDLRAEEYCSAPDEFSTSKDCRPEGENHV